MGDDLRIRFRRPGAPAPWRGRWLRGLELDIAEHGMSERQVRAAQQGRQAPASPQVAPAHVLEPSEALSAAWAAVAAKIEAVVGEDLHRMWLAHLHPHGRLAGAWHVGVDPRAARYIEQRYGRVIEEAAGRPVLLVRCDRQPLS